MCQLHGVCDNKSDDIEQDLHKGQQSSSRCIHGVYMCVFQMIVLDNDRERDIYCRRGNRAHPDVYMQCVFEVIAGEKGRIRTASQQSSSRCSSRCVYMVYTCVSLK